LQRTCNIDPRGSAEVTPDNPTALDYLTVILQLTFYILFVATLARFLRRPSRLELAVVAVFGSTAAIFGYSLVNGFAPGLLEPIRPVIIGALLAQPVLVFWMVGMVERVPRWVVPAIFVAFLISVAGIVLAPPRTAVVTLFVAAYFIVGEGGAGIMLIRGSQRRYGLARVRLALAGIGSLLFGGSIFIAAVGSAAAGAAATDPAATFVSRLGAVIAALAYLAAFAPPRALRNLAQRAIAFDLARDLVVSPTSTDPAMMWRSLGLAARDILGAREVVITDPGGRLVATTESQAEETTPATSDSAASVKLAPDRSSGPPPAGEATLDIGLAPDGRGQRLVASIDGLPLFIEDDMAAVKLLGSMTIRAVEREEAVINLAEARRELEGAAAVRASEARFRALLAADPNAVLAVDHSGVVSWATGPTGDVFGRPAHELAGMPLSELVELDSADMSQIPDTDHRVRRVQALGRRPDGETFPADVAITPFELDDVSFDLFVVSDASWRHEANLMRDRFLGILSHELRTPITSIYGGTQRLLKPGSRLDDGSRSELMAGVAAEAERLQRIIENLLVLARVERGADFFDPRPVTLRAALGDIVNHESRFWPEMEIKLHVGRALPLAAADEEYLALILRNLLSNAAKYAGAAARVEVVAEQGATEADGHETVSVRVLDNGPGITEPESDQLFSLYYRSSSAGAAPGAGIGLFVCRGLVTAMGGSIWAKPRPEGGAEFGFSLPVYTEATIPAPKATRVAAAASAP
jgi:PAS domain S-box-containing protein